MNFSNYRITLDIQKSKTQASIPVHYKDTGNRLYITLTDGGNPYIIPDGCQAVFVANRPNPETNPPLINDCIIENNSVVRYDFNNKTASVEGMHKCEIRIIGPNHELITTPSFVMVVDQRVVYDDVIADDDEIAAITALGIIASEEARVGAENIRKQREELRQKNETDRISAEGVRKTEELERQSKEKSRVSFEAARVTAENARVKAENARASTMSRLGKQVSNLVSQINGELIVTDTNVAYTKEVPARSAPYAEITKFGGMTYKTKNLFNPQWLLDANADVTVTTDGFYKGQTGWYYGAYGQSPAQLPIRNFKANTPYTIRYEGYNETVGDDTFAFKINYTDGTYTYSPFLKTTVNSKYSCETDGSKTIEKITILYNYGDMVYLRNVLIAEGTDIPYEPYFEGLRHAKPTAFKTMGVNLFDVNQATLGKNYGGETGIAFRAVSAILPYKYPMYIKANGAFNIRYEIDYMTENKYSYDAVLANSGWLTNTDKYTTPYYEYAKYIIVLFDAIDVNRALTRADIEAMQLQVSYIDFDSYSPYEEITLPIPTEVQNKDGYGIGVNATVYNYVDWINKKFHKVAGEVDIGSFDWIYGGYYAYPNVSNFAKPYGACIANVPSKITNHYINDRGVPVFIFNEGDYANADEVKSAMQGVKLDYELVKSEVDDIPSLPDDNLIAVVSKNPIIAENDYNYDVPSEIIYQLRRAT